MSETIKEIKKQLKKVRSIHSPFFYKWLHDPRKGVQAALYTKARRLIKRQKKIEQFSSRCHYERYLHRQGYQYVAGIDEVGRGPLAGPVVTCAIILPENFDLIDVNDSKQLSPHRRETLYPKILDQAIDFSVGIGSNHLIDRINIYNADRVAMKRAVLSLNRSPDYLIVDAMTIPVHFPQLKLYHGDTKSVSVGAASIVAKVYRDHLMNKYGLEYPQYDFKHNAGYGTKEHLQALRKYGITPIHRLSFAPVRRYK